MKVLALWYKLLELYRQHLRFLEVVKQGFPDLHLYRSAISF
jgi:hypothetical protein